MIFTDVFIWLLFKGVYLGQTINFGLYYGCFEQALTFPRNASALREAMEGLKFALCDSTFQGGNLLSRLLALSDSSRFVMDTVDVYGKYDGGQTQKLSYNIGLRGTRTQGLQGGLPPSTTLNINASSIVYGQSGSSRGLWGVDEADQVDGVIVQGSVIKSVADTIVAQMTVSQVADAGGQSTQWDSATVKRIRYVTPKGKQASRLPLQPADVPSVYKLGDWSVSDVISNNKKRRLKTGGR